MPRADRNSFKASTLCSLKWKIEAARAASARPSAKTSAKCSKVPAPPEAMTGMFTAEETAAVSSQSKPLFVPSRSMEVSRISPAPRSADSRAQSTAPRGVSAWPLRTYTAKRPSWRLASMATTTAWLP